MGTVLINFLIPDISAKRECAYENRKVFFSGKKQKFLKSIRFKDFKIVFRLSHNKFCNFECFYFPNLKTIWIPGHCPKT